MKTLNENAEKRGSKDTPGTEDGGSGGDAGEAPEQPEQQEGPEAQDGALQDGPKEERPSISSVHTGKASVHGIHNSKSMKIRKFVAAQSTLLRSDWLGDRSGEATAPPGMANPNGCTPIANAPGTYVFQYKFLTGS